ncbi:MAG: hypothetical protein Q3966_03905 [Neisseria sp.]|nr:hypothetical protein [Neisseria sp.]
MSRRFRPILRVLWFLVWRLAVSALVGLAVFHLLPPLQEQYGGAADNVNFSFRIIVRNDKGKGWAVKRWEEFYAGRDRAWTEALESDDCGQLKVFCRLKRIGADEYELVRISLAGTQISRYRLENGRPQPLSYTADSVFGRMDAGWNTALIALLLTLIPPFYRLWRKDGGQP